MLFIVEPPVPMKKIHLQSIKSFICLRKSEYSPMPKNGVIYPDLNISTRNQGNPVGPGNFSLGKSMVWSNLPHPWKLLVFSSKTPKSPNTCCKVVLCIVTPISPSVHMPPQRTLPVMSIESLWVGKWHSWWSTCHASQEPTSIPRTHLQELCLGTRHPSTGETEAGGFLGLAGELHGQINKLQVQLETWSQKIRRRVAKEDICHWPLVSCEHPHNHRNTYTQAFWDPSASCTPNPEHPSPVHGNLSQS